MKLATVVLAAGQGTRMRSSLPKVLHKIFSKPIIQYVVRALNELAPKKIIVVINRHGQIIKDALKGFDDILYVTQQDQKGTADALKSAISSLDNFDGLILIVNGDTPLIEPKILRDFINLHLTNSEDLSVLSFNANGEHSYGRIIRSDGKVIKIVENLDLGEEQKNIKEVNSGIYLMKPELLKLLDEIRISPLKDEYYLTDIINIAYTKGYKVNAHNIGNEEQFVGINSREDLSKAVSFVKNSVVKKWLKEGVTFLDTDSVYIDPDAEIGIDTIIYPNVYIEGTTKIGSNCVIYPNTRIIDSIIYDNVVIKDSSLIELSEIRENSLIGPFAHIRPQSKIGPSCKIGNFVEVKKSVLGKGVKASHLSYLGDAEIGNNVNIGAGTITCNYDGINKHKTIIEDDVFIGSDTQLVAPVRIGKNSYIGAGSTITKEVPSSALAISRTPQKNLKKLTFRKSIKKNVKGDNAL
ncbi:MAG: bifunctional UDP-N-acetylglucosamine diphosphorylase/glucosamine-1-phosphate N-acetyltransferase GlmU [Thermodesulfovibrionales bacterium]|nr:bifunctional UDP-N-acetylglucosamine diphosphorylase/glucosamine-1-phosphate N-acetyltransferase GlmU [Thermodesulfovibrionales bacterium]